MGGSDGTAGAEYAARMKRLAAIWWKRVLPVQAPYRWNIRRLCEGRTLEVGCGAGRNLEHLRDRAAGVDHNLELVEEARRRGLRAYTVEEFLAGEVAVLASFDSLLFAHVLEHMHRSEAVDLVEEYLPYLRPGGRVVAITPQERGFASDPTHVEFLDENSVSEILEATGTRVERTFSFPFPRWAGGLFTYNESVTVGKLA